MIVKVKGYSNNIGLLSEDNPLKKVSHSLGKNFTIGECMYNIIELVNKNMIFTKINHIFFVKTSQ